MLSLKKIGRSCPIYRYGLLSIIFFLLGLTSLTAQQLASRKILSQKVEILMPSNFRQMDMNTILVKYPSEGNRPTEVYTNNNSSVNLVFTHSVKKATINDIKKHADELINILKQKGVNVIEQKQKKINKNDFFIVVFYSKAINGSIYNRMFFTVLDGRLLIGNFNCTSIAESIYKPQLDAIIESIKF